MCTDTHQLTLNDLISNLGLLDSCRPTARLTSKLLVCNKTPGNYSLQVGRNAVRVVTCAILHEFQTLLRLEKLDSTRPVVLAVPHTHLQCSVYGL